MSDKDKPELWMFVGPNGSGKSTITKRFAQEADFPALYINADDIKKAEKRTDFDAQQSAWSACKDALANKKDFAYETVGSHESKVDLMKLAKNCGYTVRLFFVCTQDPQINALRVQTRVKAGGHDVPADKIESRYHRSMRLLQDEFKIADEACVFNNSWEKPIMIAYKAMDGKVTLMPENKNNPNSSWTKENVATLLGLEKDSSTPSFIKTVKGNQR